MQLELYYDPVRPETTVFIDGKKTERSDIFGFLYPVRNCILQTWLPESGSWSGLKQQLRELARGERVQVSFHGRTEDYADLQAALSGTSWVETVLIPWDPVAKEAELCKEARQLLGHIITTSVLMEEIDEVRNEKTMRDLFPGIASDIDDVLEDYGKGAWQVTIRTEEDFAKATRSYGSCCVIENDFFSSYEQFAKLERLFPFSTAFSGYGPVLF